MIEHMDNFSAYGTNAALILNGVYAQNEACSITADPAPGATGRCLLLPASYGGGGAYAKLRYVFQVPATTVGCCGRVWLAELTNNVDMVQAPFELRDASNNALYTMCFDTTGRIVIRQGNHYGEVIYTTPLPVVTANGWYHIEFKVVKSATVGSIEVRVEGNEVVSLTEMDTGAGAVYQVEFANRSDATSNGRSYYMKDIVIWNQEGTYNTDWMGSVVVYNMQPTADVDLNWTPSVGSTGWEILDNSPPVTGQYLAAPTPPPLPYVCEVNDVPADVTTVRGIMTMVRAAKTDGGDAGFQVGIISDPDGVPATALGANRPITVAQTYWRDVFEEDPKTNAPFLPSALNALNLQLNRTM